VLDQVQSPFYDAGLAVGLVLALLLFAPFYLLLAALQRAASAAGGPAKPA
jgi:hypothetical protein